MSSSENFEQWDINSWISETFARDNEAINRALQYSLADHSDADLFSPSSIIVKAETASSQQTPSVSGSDLETPVPKRRNNGVAKGKITKRKSRASKRSSTTFITADPANFRQMVQQVTGVKFGNGHIPVAPVVKPEPHRAFNRFQGCLSLPLPTLDTSAFLLDHHQQMVGPTVAAMAQQGMGYVPPGMVAEGGAGFDFESFSSFPTLESWKVM